MTSPEVTIASKASGETPSAITCCADRRARPRRVGDQHHHAAAPPERDQRVGRRAKRLAAVVQHAPDVAEDRVVAVGDFAEPAMTGTRGCAEVEVMAEGARSPAGRCQAKAPPARASGCEIVRLVDIGDQPRLRRPPTHQFPRLRARRRAIDRRKMGEPPEVIGRFVRLYADHRQAEASPDDAGDVAKWDALFGDRVIASSRGVPSPARAGKDAPRRAGERRTSG